MEKILTIQENKDGQEEVLFRGRLESGYMQNIIDMTGLSGTDWYAPPLGELSIKIPKKYGGNIAVISMRSKMLVSSHILMKPSIKKSMR